MSNKRIERINDSQLSAQLNAVRAHIRRTRKHEGNTDDAEIELCYLEREQEHRENSRKAHDHYMKAIYEEMQESAKEEEEALREYMKGENYNNDQY